MKPEPTTWPAPTGTTVEYQVRFSAGPKGKKRVRAAVPIAKAVAAPPVAPPPRPAPRIPPVVSPPRVVAAPTPEEPPPTPTPRVPKITLLLVLGHRFERLVRSVVVKDYAEIARRTGLTRARVTQIVNLTLLAPEVQDELLARPDCVLPVERQLRTLSAVPNWNLQQRFWKSSVRRRAQLRD